MSVEVQVTDKQSFEVIIHGPDGANRIIIYTVKLNTFFYASDNTGSGVVQKETFTALIDPQLASGEFKRAIALASFVDFGHIDSDPGQVDGIRWAIEEAQADFDDGIFETNTCNCIQS